MAEKGFHGDREADTQRKEAGEGHRRGSGEYGRKRKGTSSVLGRTVVEVVQLSGTQEKKETHQKMDKTERFLRSTGA